MVDDLTTHGGFLRQFLVDDKGCVMIVAFGVPTFSYNDNAARALECACSLLQVLQSHDGRAYVGVTTGRTYCGLIGTDQRHEYAIVGDVVNLSARLMSRAAKNQDIGILADALTHHEYRIQRMHHQTLNIEILGGIHVKGKEQDVQIVRATPRSEPTNHGSLTIGWEEELCIVRNHLDHTIRSSREAGLEASHRLVFISADAGYGKTHFLQSITHERRCNDLCNIYIRANSRDTPINMRFFHKLARMICCNGAPWDDSIVDAFELVLQENLGEKDDHRLLRIGLERLFGTYSYPSRIFDDWMTSPDEAMLVVLQDVVRCLCSQRRMPNVLLIDDAHHVDHVSWELLCSLCDAATSPLFITLTSLPTRGNALDRFVAQTTHRGHVVSSLRLGPMRQQDVRALVRKAFHDVRWDDQVLDYLASESSGSPFLCKEMARGLYASAIQHSRDSVHLHDTSSVSFDIENAVTLRIDALSVETRGVVKCASVLGIVFNIQTLAYLVENSGHSTHQLILNSALTELVTKEFVTTCPSAGVYQFRHETVRLIIYNMLTPQDLCMQHSQVAYYIESNFADLIPHFASLIWHYVLCQQFSRAMIYTIHAMHNYISLGLIKEAVDVANSILAHPLCITDLLSLRTAVLDSIKREKRNFARLMDAIGRKRLSKTNRLRHRRKNSIASTNSLFELAARISNRIHDLTGTDSQLSPDVACSVPAGCAGCNLL